MDLPADLLHLFHHLRAGRARRTAAAWAHAGRLDTWLPAVGGHDAHDSLRRRSRWLQALDEWHFRQGPLSPALLLASRLWGLAADCPAAAAFPWLAQRPELADGIDAVRLGQIALEGHHADTWRRWPPWLRLEALRLLRWRELTGERPVGEAARCYAALTAMTGGDTPASPAPGAEAGTGRRVLTGSQPLGATVEDMLLGWGVAQVREPADTVLACLVAALRWRGHLLRFTDLQAEWPLPNAGLTLAGWQRLCRRVGLTATEAAPQDIGPPGRHALCHLRDGRCLLLMGGDRVYAPGAAHPFRQLQPGALRSGEVGLLAALDGAGSAEVLLRRPVRRLRLETLTWQQIPAAMEELVTRLAERPAGDDPHRLAAALARVFMDFLRIHPFLNGNRCMAMALATAWAAREGRPLDWSGLSRLQLHHAVRCAAAGHARPLVQALAGCLRTPAATAR
ncbi:MAG: hypothetical protein EKK53_12220 [Burkholderiales bacterium]|nr:MAG: hypothetical protein EKK53_12220 [Burkholderiales bacterium]